MTKKQNTKLSLKEFVKEIPDAVPEVFHLPSKPGQTAKVDLAADKFSRFNLSDNSNNDGSSNGTGHHHPGLSSHYSQQGHADYWGVPPPPPPPSREGYSRYSRNADYNGYNNHGSRDHSSGMHHPSGGGRYNGNNGYMAPPAAPSAYRPHVHDNFKAPAAAAGGTLHSDAAPPPPPRPSTRPKYNRDLPPPPAQSVTGAYDPEVMPPPPSRGSYNRTAPFECGMMPPPPPPRHYPASNGGATQSASAPKEAPMAAPVVPDPRSDVPCDSSLSRSESDRSPGSLPRSPRELHGKYTTLAAAPASPASSLATSASVSSKTSPAKSSVQDQPAVTSTEMPLVQDLTMPAVSATGVKNEFAERLAQQALQRLAGKTSVSSVKTVDLIRSEPERSQSPGSDTLSARLSESTGAPSSAERSRIPTFARNSSRMSPEPSVPVVTSSKASSEAGDERPKLNLLPRTLPVESAPPAALIEMEGGRKRLQLQPRSRDTSVADNSRAENKPSIFGAARPREEVLKERGVELAHVRPADLELAGVKTVHHGYGSVPSVRASRAGSVTSGYSGDESRQTDQWQTVSKGRKAIRDEMPSSAMQAPYEDVLLGNVHASSMRPLVGSYGSYGRQDYLGGSSYGRSGHDNQYHHSRFKDEEDGPVFKRALPLREDF